MSLFQQLVIKFPINFLQFPLSIMNTKNGFKRDGKKDSYHATQPLHIHNFHISDVERENENEIEIDTVRKVYFNIFSITPIVINIFFL